MKGKKSKEKRYFCDWYKKYFLGVEDEVYVDGEWIFTPVSEKILKWRGRIETSVIVVIMLVSIAMCAKWFYPQGMYYTLFIEKSEPVGDIFIVIFIGALIGGIASVILGAIVILSTWLASEISETRKRKDINKS